MCATRVGRVCHLLVFGTHDQIDAPTHHCFLNHRCITVNTRKHKTPQNVNKCPKGILQETLYIRTKCISWKCTFLASDPSSPSVATIVRGSGLTDVREGLDHLCQPITSDDPLNRGASLQDQ